MERAINQRIANTDIFVFSRDANGLFTYSRPITLEEGKEVAEGTGLGVTREGVLYNMSTLKGIVANRKLMKQTDGKVWFPTISEGLLLNDAGLFPVGELMAFGIAVYDSGNPDKEIAKVLTETAKQQGYALPLLASFRALDLREGGKRYGFTPVIVSADDLITGKDAIKTLEKFVYIEDSGVRKLYLNWSGTWSSGFGGELDYFNENCRVGRVSALGGAKNLRDLVSSQIEQKYNVKKADYTAQINDLQGKLRGLVSSQIKQKYRFKKADYTAQINYLQGKLQSLDTQERECVASAERILQ